VGSLALDLATALDPSPGPGGGIEPDDWQAASSGSVGARMCSTAVGRVAKSTITSVLAVHRRSTCRIADPAPLARPTPIQRALQEMLDRVPGSRSTVPAESETALTLTLENGSRIVALPGQERRSAAIPALRLLCVDEASRVRDPLYMSIRPMLAVSSGRCWCLSHAVGAPRVLSQEWTEGGDSWERVEITA